MEISHGHGEMEIGNRKIVLKGQEFKAKWEGNYERQAEKGRED